MHKNYSIVIFLLFLTGCAQSSQYKNTEFQSSSSGFVNQVDSMVINATVQLERKNYFSLNDRLVDLVPELQYRDPREKGIIIK